MAINNNLYPPIVDSYMPAFLIDSGNALKDTCRVYFSLSAFNSFNDIKDNAQVIVRNQNTNLSMLNPEKYPCEVMLTTVHEDVTRKTDDKYYIDITKNDMVNDKFEINQYYKVQIRFTGANAASVSLATPQQIDGWLAANLDKFSEWSTVCLVRGISSPTLSVNNFDVNAEVTYLADANVDILGTLTFADPAEEETLRSYQIKLYDDTEEDRPLIIDSGVLYSDSYLNTNNINYTLDYMLIEGNAYVLSITYTTQNLYTDTIEYPFVAVQTYADKLDASLAYVIDEANAAIGIHVKAHEAVKPIVGNITIRRTSSESNFTIWEDVHTFAVVEDQELDYTWYDFTIESGVWYRYCAQKRSSTGQRGVIVELKEPKMLLFDDMYLTGYNRQLKIQFNPSVSSFKRNVLESNTVTIGGKYPYIKRNGNAYYRSFPISGLISSAMDEDNIFTSKEKIYKSKENIELYDDFNKTNRIPIEYDFTYEREFREQVEEFLMQNNVKLFRSPTEGNILVKLQDVNFTPNQTLGRRLYSFSATAYEIDDYTIDNCSKYGIQSLGAYEVHITYPNMYFGQIMAEIPANTNVLSMLKDKYQQKAEKGYEINIDSLDYLNLEIEDKPYLIYDAGTGPYVAEPEVFATLAATTAQKATFLGYLAYINDMPIVINPDGHYSLTNDGVEITSLYFPVPTNVNLDYNANVSQTYIGTSGESGGDEPEPGGGDSDARTLTFTPIVGQVFGGFGYKDSIVNKIWDKYYQIYSDYSQSLYYLNDISIEANPNVVVYVKEDVDKDYEKHIIGPTCMLAFQNEYANITGIYFVGIHFEAADEAQMARESLPEFVYRETDTTLDETTLMRDYPLVKNGVYTLTPEFIQKHSEMIAHEESPLVNSSRNTIIKKSNEGFAAFMAQKIANSGNRYIWHNDRFWIFTEDHDLLCPVEATINYSCDVIKERYV